MLKCCRNQRSDSPYLTWSGIQPLLENAIPHVLIILDCCYAANAARDTSEGTTKELLAAYAQENRTIGVGPRSFTSALIEELWSFGCDPFTVVKLHSRLVNIQWRLKFTPFYASLSEHGGNSITLRPLSLSSISDIGKLTKPEDTVLACDPMDTSNPGESFYQERGQNSSRLSTSSTSSVSDTRVLLAVSVTEDASLDIDQWVRWLTTRAPWAVTQVRVGVENVYKSHSTVVVVSIPAVAWNRLITKEAYKFICFIKSENLIPRPYLRDRSDTSVFSQTSIYTPDTSESISTPKIPLPGVLSMTRSLKSTLGAYNLRSRLSNVNDSNYGALQRTRTYSQLGVALMDGPTTPRVSKTSPSNRNRKSSTAKANSTASRTSLRTDLPEHLVRLSSWSPEEELLLLNKLGSVRAKESDGNRIAKSLVPTRSPSEVCEKYKQPTETLQATQTPKARHVVANDVPLPTSQISTATSSKIIASDADFSRSMVPVHSPPFAYGRESKPWSSDDDATLQRARQRSLDWSTISKLYFPTKTANGCRKRFERLISKNIRAEDWDNARIEQLAQLYMELREQMWTTLAAKMSEGWQIIEQKVNYLLSDQSPQHNTNGALIVYGAGPRNPPNSSNRHPTKRTEPSRMF